MFNINEVVGCIARCDYYMNLDTDSENGNESDLTNLKIQKLLYYIQGHFLAEFGVVLFEDNIKAWKHGPVISEVYNTMSVLHVFSENSSSASISQYIFNDCKNYDYTRIVKDERAFDLIYRIMKYYNKYSPWGLRNMTHEEKPWNSTPLFGIISTDLLKDFFSQKNIKARIKSKEYQPNKETIKILEESMLGVGVKSFFSVEEMFNDLYRELEEDGFKAERHA